MRQNAAIGSEYQNPSIYGILSDNDGDVCATMHAYRAGFFRFSWNDSLGLTFVLKGKLTLHSERGIQEILPDVPAVISPYVGHAAIQGEPDTVAAVLLISRSFLKKVIGYVPTFTVPDHMPEADLIQAAAAGFYLAMTTQPESPSAQLFARAQLLEILSFLTKYSTTAPRTGKSGEGSRAAERKLSSVLSYIDRHYREDLSLTATAEHFSCTSSYLSAFFSAHVGLSFHEYLTRKRLEYAIRELNHSDGPLLDIALDAGFPNAKSFYLAFHRYLALTPGEYRTLLQTRGLYGISGSRRLPCTDPIVAERIDALLESAGSAAKSLQLLSGF